MDEKINYKKLSEGVIIYILKSGDRHIEEIREIILQNFFNISSSAIYPIFSNMVKKNLIKEYRFSNPDGSRRKFYTVTEKGLKDFDENYIFYFKNAPIIPIKKEDISEVKVQTEKFEKKKNTKEIINETKEQQSFVETDHQTSPYDEIISDIDFSSISAMMNNNQESIDVIDDKNTQDVNENNIDTNANDSIWNNTQLENNEQSENEENFDNILDKNKDYISLLTTYYPQKREITPVQPIVETPQPPVEPTPTTDINIVTDQNFTDIYDYAENNGITIKTSADTNRYQGTNILVNKLRLHTSLITMLSILVLYLFTTLIFYKQVGFNGKAFLTVLIISLIPVIVSLFMIVFNANKTKKELKKFKEVIEIALILAISSVIITIAVAAFREIDYKSFKDIYYSLIVPFIIEINIPIFEIIKYSIYKKNRYQS